MSIWSEIVADVEEGVRRRVFGDFGVEDLVVADATVRRDGPIPARNDHDALRGAYEIALDRVERRRRVLDECAAKMLYTEPLDFARVLTVASDPVSGANATSGHVDLHVSAVAYVESLATALRDRMEIARRDDASKRPPPRGGAPAFIPLRLATLIRGDVAVRSARELDVPEIMSLQASCWPPEHRDDEAEIRRLLREATVIVADDGRSVIGAAVGWVEGETSHVYAVEVAPHRRRSGLGARLLSAVLDATSTPSRTVTATAATQDGLKLLTRAGFHVSGTVTEGHWAGRPRLVRPGVADDATSPRCPSCSTWPQGEVGGCVDPWHAATPPVGLGPAAEVERVTYADAPGGHFACRRCGAKYVDVLTTCPNCGARRFGPVAPVVRNSHHAHSLSPEVRSMLEAGLRSASTEPLHDLGSFARHAGVKVEVVVRNDGVEPFLGYVTWAAAGRLTREMTPISVGAGASLNVPVATCVARVGDVSVHVSDVDGRPPPAHVHVDVVQAEPEVVGDEDGRWTCRCDPSTTAAPEVLLGSDVQTSQYAIVGTSGERKVGLDLNGTNVVGVFGDDPSDTWKTVSAIVESAVERVPNVSELPAPLAAVVFRYGGPDARERGFPVATSPNVNPDDVRKLRDVFGASPAAVRDVLVLCPEHAAEDASRRYPGCLVKPIKFGPSDLDAYGWKVMLGLYGDEVGYVDELGEVVREALRTSGGAFMADALRHAADTLSLPGYVRSHVERRIRHVAPYLDDGARVRDLLRPGRVVVVDLCGTLAREHALELFVTLMRAFQSTLRDAAGGHFMRILAFEDAHRFLRENAVADEFVQAVLEARHHATSVVVESRDVSSVPLAVVELSSILFVHETSDPRSVDRLRDSSRVLDRDLSDVELAGLGPDVALVWAQRSTDLAFTESPRRVSIRPSASARDRGREGHRPARAPGAPSPDLRSCREELSVAREAHAVRELRSSQEAAALKAEVEGLKRPVAMFLTCPRCGGRHVDVGAFATKPHHTHSCQKCGLTWRPAVQATVGVKFLPGFRDAEDDGGFADVGEAASGERAPERWASVLQKVEGYVLAVATAVCVAREYASTSGSSGRSDPSEPWVATVRRRRS